MADRIISLSGQWAGLSNFAPVTLVHEDITYPTSEHLFQALKSTDPAVRRVIASLATPGQAKRYGRSMVVLCPDWDTVKRANMMLVLTLKFQQKPYRDLLLSTGDAEIIEGNTWGDLFWGAVMEDGVLTGQNVLGHLLMALRESLRKKVTINTDGGGATHSKLHENIGASAYIAVCGDKQFSRAYAYKDMTNNRAELLGIYHALKEAVRAGYAVTVKTDSEDCVKWLNGTYKRKNPHVQVYCGWIDEEIQRITSAGGSVTFEHVPRELNKEADALCTGAMNAVHAGLIDPRPEPWKAAQEAA